MSDRKSRDIASRVEVIKIHERLKASLEMIGDEADRLCRYTSGVDDHSIAAELGVSVHSVANLRKEVFGMLQAARPSTTTTAADPRVDELVTLSQNLLKHYIDLRDRHNRLAMQLSLQQILDCRHLVVPDGKTVTGGTAGGAAGK